MPSQKEGGSLMMDDFDHQNVIKRGIRRDSSNAQRRNMLGKVQPSATEMSFDEEIGGSASFLEYD